MSRASRRVLHTALSQLSAATGLPDFTGIGFRAGQHAFNSPFRSAEAASAALLAGASIASSIGIARRQQTAGVDLSSRHVEASLLSFLYLRFTDPERAPPARIAPEGRTAAAGFFRAGDDRWVYLHPGFPHNTEGLLRLLGTADDRDAVTARIRETSAQRLEDQVAVAGLCGAMVRTPEEWDDSVPGRLLRTQPVVEIIQIGESPPEPPLKSGSKPLDGLKVLDLTRILAGPTCARTLASYGAGVLRVGAEHLPSIPLFVADTGFGKRSCHLDLNTPADLATLKRLVGEADVFSQSYRTGVMEHFGVGAMDLAKLRPGIVTVSINCYGHEGDWRSRPGWEQLAQTVTGMAQVQGSHLGTEGPTLMPAAVNDYTTGYLAALGTLAALRRRAETGGSYWVRVSLARTAMWIRDLGSIRNPGAKSLSDKEIDKYSATMESSWGPVRYLRPAVTIAGTDVGWRLPPEPLGSSAAVFD